MNLFGHSLSVPARIGDNLEVDVLIDRQTTFDTEVTTNPVEDGFPVSDHVTRKPMTLTMTCVFTPTAVTYAWRSSSSGRLAQVARALQEIYKKGDPVTVTLPDAIYQNMIMTRAPIVRNVQDGVAYRLQIAFMQVRIVKQKTAEVSEDDSGPEASGMGGESEKDAGAANQSEIGTGMIIVDNQNVISTNTQAADYANAGDISTKKEFTANSAALSLALSLGA